MLWEGRLGSGGGGQERCWGWSGLTVGRGGPREAGGWSVHGEWVRVVVKPGDGVEW